MSITATCKTQIKDQDALVEALTQIYGKNSIIQNDETVIAHRNPKDPTIIINIPKLYGKTGYRQIEDGTWELVYDSSSKETLKDIVPYEENGVTYDRLTQTYAKMKIMRAVKQLRGRIVQENTDEEGTIRIRARVTHYS